MTEDHLGINREPDSPEVIVYRGSIFGEYNVILLAYIKDLSNRLYEVNQSYFWNRQTRSPVVSHWDEEIPSPIILYLISQDRGKTSVSMMKSGFAIDELALYASSNDTEQGPPFTDTRKRLGMSYHPCILYVF